MQIIYYAIREIGTNNYLPASKRKSGFTHDEPVDIYVHPPRIFKTKQHAQMALNWWIEGEFEQTSSVGYDSFYEDEVSIDKIPGTERTNRKMEIVQIRLMDVYACPECG